MDDFKVEHDIICRDGKEVCLIKLKGDFDGSFRPWSYIAISSGPKANYLFQVLANLMETGRVEWEIDQSHVHFLIDNDRRVIRDVADFALDIAKFAIWGRINRYSRECEPIDAKAIADIKAFFAKCRQRHEQENDKVFIDLCYDELNRCAVETEVTFIAGMEVHVIKIKGDMPDSGGLHKVLKEEIENLFAAGHFNLEIDLKKVSYIDSLAEGLLMSTFRQARQSGGNVIPFNANAKLANTFNLLGFTRLMSIYGVGEYSEEQRRKAWQRPEI